MNTWTKEQLDYEWNVVWHTRIGILCGGDEPTYEQMKIAITEAHAHIAKLKAQEKHVSERT